jgi:hypothetical protein
MKQEDADKRAKRNAASRLRYWADRRLKDIIRRRAQVEGWVETYDSILEEKDAKAAKISARRAARPNIQPEARAA